MRVLTATEVVRNFSHLLSSLEHGTEEVTIVRNHRPIAKLVPGCPHMTALEALADLHRTLDDGEGEQWLEDTKRLDTVLSGGLRDPWA